MAAAHKVIVYGGKGALGSKCVEFFKSKQWWVASIDLTSNEEANANIIVKMSESFTEQADQVTVDVASLLGEQKVDAIICVAGGWAGGSAKAKSLYKNADLMWKQSMWTSTISSHLATKHLKDGGLLTLTGASAALNGTAGMVGYGMAKAAVHQLCRSLAGEKSGMPAGSSALAILPKWVGFTEQPATCFSVAEATARGIFWPRICQQDFLLNAPLVVGKPKAGCAIMGLEYPAGMNSRVTLDTPMNRKSMPSADFSSWTPLEFVAETLFNWIDKETRPTSGSLVQLITTGSKTELIPAQL